MTSLTTAKVTGRGADIPAPRGEQGVRLLVLGVDEDARLLRERAVEAGLELAQRYSARVSHVAYGSGVDPEDGRYAKIRDAGLVLQPIGTCARQLGLAAAEPVAAEAVDEQEPESDDYFEDDDLDDLDDLDDDLDEIGGPDEDPFAAFVPGFGDPEQVRVPEPPAVQDAVSCDAASRDGVDEIESTVLAGAVVGADSWLGEMRASTALEYDEVDVTVFTSEDSGIDTPTDPGPDPTDLATTTTTATLATDPRLGGPRLLMASFAWALIPLVSLGLLTPVAFGYAAVRTRSRLLAAATLGYALAVVLAFALSAVHPQTGSTATGTGGLLTFALAVPWLGGTGHALSSRAKVFGG